MMFDKRLISMVSESKRYIAGNIIFQWLGMLANILLMSAVSLLISDLYDAAAAEVFTGLSASLLQAALIILIALFVRYACNILSARMAFLSGKAVKKRIRELIYSKLLRLGASYKDTSQTSEVVQIAVEGVDQLEIYFAQYLPQFFYSVLAPVTLFIALCFVNVLSAVILLICVPLIPVAIMAVQTWAKKLLSKYWDQYTTLGDTFLENLQGLTTLKIYQADAYKHQQMNEESEKFRKITMRVLIMQLNSITIMDLVTYGGTALGLITALVQLSAGKVDLYGCLLIILLAVEFFLPMRLLGSYFHISMNGMAASDKIFRLLEASEPESGTKEFPAGADICLQDVHFAYEEGWEVLHGIDMTFPAGSFTAIVGESGCGKSTVASLVMGRSRNYQGSIALGAGAASAGSERRPSVTEPAGAGENAAGDVILLQEISEESLMEHVTYVGLQSYLFKGTVRDNLLMGCPSASEDAMWQALEQVKLSDFLRSEQGLDTKLAERASNLSGGQCQRLALARAILHDSPVYIFDEATSNIDVESENDILALIRELSKTKTVLMITHRLANTTDADRIYVMDAGCVVGSGTHEELLTSCGHYAALWNTQQALERFGREAL